MSKLILFLLIALFPFCAGAQKEARSDAVFKARVEKIIAEQASNDAHSSFQQHLLLIGQEGDYAGKEIDFNGIGNVDVLSNQAYDVGDMVLVAASFTDDGQVSYYVVDFVRTNAIWLIFGLFVLATIIVGRMKGIRSILSLSLTFFVILKYIIPQILSGSSPLIVTVIGSLVILIIVIYATEGFNSLSHVACISILFSLLITIALSYFFVTIARLNGATSEEVLFLFDIDGLNINLQGLLLAGMIIGTLGVLDDIVISQVATVKELSTENLSQKQVFAKAYNIGVSHISSMTNTLFLAYAGVSLPLLILFVSGTSAFSGWQQAVNTEMIATEIIRTLAGSIGLILSVPISTFVAVKWFKKK